jgi:hypothetical protein
MKLVLLFLTIISTDFTNADVIETPLFDCRSPYSIPPPDDWDYRTFDGQNGLIAVFWPGGCSFNATANAVFVLLIDYGEPIPDVPHNIEILKGKCPYVNFMIPARELTTGKTASISKPYFGGLCGRTMVVFRAFIGNRILIVMLATSGDATTTQMAAAREIFTNYQAAIRKALKT